MQLCKQAIKRVRIVLLATIYLTCISQNVSAESYVVTDSFGKHKFSAPPQRIVVTDWALLEQLLELGIKPVGAPELERYQRYVVQPALPSDIVDIGLRKAPNIKAIRSLKPDVIILGTDQKNLARPFSRISRVMFYKSFSDKYRTNGKKSETRFLQIADLFQLGDFAKQRLEEREQELKQIKQHVHTMFNGKPPKLSVIRFSSAKKALLYGENSIVSHTLEKLELDSALNSSRTKWGEREVTIKQLQKVNEGVLLYVEPVESNSVFSSEAWQDLPLVKAKHVGAMSPVWSYGGAMSVLYNARAIRDALAKMAGNY